MLTSIYKVGGPISANARGCCGQILKCTRTTDALEFAVKRVSKNNSYEGNSQITTMKLLDNEHIMKMVDCFEDSDYFYIVMEIAKGGDLFERIVSKGWLRDKEAVNIFAQILTAVSHMHNRNIMHCDIKPENILLMSPSGNDVKLCDFGFAQTINNDCSTLEHCGTPTYTAPEVLDGFAFDAKADMWSLGVLLYAMLSGRAPFGQQRSPKLARRIRMGELNFNDVVFRDVSADAIDLIRRLVVVEPSKRLSAEEALRHPWVAGRVEEKGQESV